MQQTLSGVSRYLDGPESLVLPVGITGSESMFPIGEDALYAVHIVASAGPPIDAAELRSQARGDRRLMMDAVSLAIAERLPPEYRGAYADDAPDLDQARALLARLRR
jgi:1-acyl-sn-glycerol-3-phosphate acyltransferase